VLGAANGVAALEAWRSRTSPIDLLLTDLVMPGGVSGQKLAETLQAEAPAMRVVYMSGFPGNLTGQGLNLRDGVNFLQKPFTPSHLAQTVRNRLDAT
jgi:two-component system, cell cycle sensor histidine kinase and response regulator CckA